MIVSACVVAWALAVASVTTWACVRPRRAGAEAAARPAPLRLLLLRPCAGDEPRLDEALRSSGSAPRAASVRLLVSSAEDLAAATARAVAADLASRGVDASLVVTRAVGPNRKVDQLARAVAAEVLAFVQPAREAELDVVVVADSDVRLTSEDLAALLDPIARGSAHATWAPPVEVAPQTVADELSASLLGASLHAFPLLARLDDAGMVGKLFAVRRDALTAVGGFGALVSHLGEDMELARAMRAAGLTVRATHRRASSLASGRTLASVFARYARWITVVRAQRPWLLPSYPLLFAAAPLQLTVALGALPFERASAALAVLAVLAVRAGVASAASRAAGLPLGVTRVAISGLLADAVLLAAFVRALLVRKVVWRGAPLRIARGGLLVEEGS